MNARTDSAFCYHKMNNDNFVGHKLQMYYKNMQKCSAAVCLGSELKERVMKGP